METVLSGAGISRRGINSVRPLFFVDVSDESPAGVESIYALTMKSDSDLFANEDGKIAKIKDEGGE